MDYTNKILEMLNGEKLEQKVADLKQSQKTYDMQSGDINNNKSSKTERTLTSYAGKQKEQERLRPQQSYPTLKNYDKTKFEIKKGVLEEYKGKESEVKIPEGVTEIGVGAFFRCTSLVSITISNEVTKIGNNAFGYCKSLTSITISESVTEIGRDAFRGCTSLTSVTIPDGVTKIGDYAFYGCKSLTSITIPDGVAEIGDYAFIGCTSLKKVYINDLTAWCKIIFADYSSNPLNGAGLYIGNQLINKLVIPEGVTKIGNYAFYKCASLTSVIIPKGVTEIGESSFSGCSSLKKVYISNLTAWCNINFNYSDANPLSNGAELYLDNKVVTELIIPAGVTTISRYAFRGCTSITSVTIPEGVTEIGEGAFEYCTSLTSVNIPAGVISIGYAAFQGCTSLTSITIPESVTSIGGDAFEYCTSLTSVTIPESVTAIGVSVFGGCSKLESIEVAEGNANYASQGGILYNKEKTEIVEVSQGIKGSVTIPEGVTSIGDWAFRNCDSLTSITIPDGVIKIGKYAFWDCTSLTSVTIPEGVTEIGSSAFSGCTLLESIEVAEGNVNYASQGGILYNKEKTSIVIVPPGIKGSVTISKGVTKIGGSSFSSCTSLTSVTIPASVTKICKNAFLGCCHLAEVYNNSSLSIRRGQTNNGYIAFYAVHVYGKGETQSKLKKQGDFVFYDDTDGTYLLRYDGEDTDITLPNYSKNYRIWQYAFYKCTALTSVTIPESVTEIGWEAFDGCTSLTSVTIEGVTEIGHFAFGACASLSSVTISESVTEICGYAFSWCKLLTRIDFRGTIDEWKAITKGDFWNENTGNYTVYCTDGSITKRGVETRN